ncbi:Reticulon-like protein B11 [Nymphaea thermarum]|nr:Reticulon-like protein B11 [Nymphaea thermarum]
MADDQSSSSSGNSTLDPNSRKSLHQCLGGGSGSGFSSRVVADILLWRWRNACIMILVASSTVWLLFDRMGYSFVSFISNVLLLLVSILFFWAKSASLLNRPLPPLPNLQLSEDCAVKASDLARFYINSVLAVARDITTKKDVKLLLKVVIGLWLLSYIGSLFSFLTFVYIGIIISLSAPVLYEKYQDLIDERLSVTHSVVLKRYRDVQGMVLSRVPLSSMKEKKTQ